MKHSVHVFLFANRAARFFLAACVTLFVCGASAAVLYVDGSASNPVPPYADWSTAAASIQDAIDAASAGDVIWVTNGVYQTGGRPVIGSVLTNRVMIDKAVTVQSVNGATNTIIEGYQDPATTEGIDAVRGAYVADGAKLIGFTVQHGATLIESNAFQYPDDHGGGVRCENTNAFVASCIIQSNVCALYGAGAYSGTLSNCQVNYNFVKTSESFGGGAVAFSVVTDSTINSNSVGGAAGEPGAGAYSCVLSNCTFSGNLKSGVNGCWL
jgi:hypothetical protein